MIDLREYKDLIRKLVAEESAKDENWKWSVKSITKSKVLIRWSYLDGEPHPRDCFSITTNEYPDDEFTGNNVTYRHPTGEMISFTSFGDKSWDTASTPEEAIEQAIRGISYYAHSRY